MAAARTGSADRLERRGRCEVDDVNPRRGRRPGARGDRWPRARQPPAGSRATSHDCAWHPRAHRARRAIRRARAAGRAQQHGHGLIEILLADMREFVHSRRTEKTLEAEHPGSCERLEMIHIARHHPAPERHVHTHSPAAARRFVSSASTDVVANAVERHVHDRRDAARRGRSRRVPKTFPVGAAGLVHVHVGIDETGQDHQVAPRR